MRRPLGQSTTPPTPGATRDQAMVARVRAGEVAAVEALHAEHHDALWRFPYDLVRSAEGAEEVVQEVFLALWRGRAEWVVSTSVAGWLYGTTRHLALRQLRQARAVVRLTDRTATYADASDRTVDDPHDALEARELDEVVTRALATLPERRRRAMMLRWTQQLTAPEIAQALGTTPDAVRVLLTRARQELAALLRY